MAKLNAQEITILFAMVLAVVVFFRIASCVETVDDPLLHIECEERND